MKLTELVVCEASLGIFFYGLEDTAQFALKIKLLNCERKSVC